MRKTYYYRRESLPEEWEHTCAELASCSFLNMSGDGILNGTKFYITFEAKAEQKPKKGSLHSIIEYMMMPGLEPQKVLDMPAHFTVGRIYELTCA